MNAYDFDDTIYKGDSGIDLIKYTFKKKPFLMIKYLFITLFFAIKYYFKKSTYKEVKEKLFGFLREIKNLEEYIDLFVNIHMKNIKPWYYEIQKKDDVLISASYDLWINKFAQKINIKNVISTKYDIKTGKIIGENCLKEEKLKRFDKEFPNKIIKKSYSDSPNDIPLLKRAEQGFVVKDDKITKYYKGYKF
jgi:HAD superfamily phosphoserine phosphatase-like hydrolase